MNPAKDNALFFGDNLDILRQNIPDESVDLVYIDPPFNSKRNYNVLFSEQNGTKSSSQISAFDDTWKWGEQAERTFEEIREKCSPKLTEMVLAFLDFIGRNDVTAYLMMMAIRLVELHRTLKKTGSLYLHCDPTAALLLLYLILLFITPISGQHPATKFVGLTWYAFLVCAVVLSYILWSSILISVVAIIALYVLQFILQFLAGSILHHAKN